MIGEVLVKWDFSLIRDKNHYLKNKIVQNKMEKKFVRNQEQGQPENPLGQAEDLTPLRRKKTDQLQNN